MIGRGKRYPLRNARTFRLSGARQGLGKSNSLRYMLHTAPT
jgi:hypothetical protein